MNNVRTLEDYNPYIGVDEESDVLIGQNAELTVGYSMELPTVFTCDVKTISECMKKHMDGFGLLPVGTCVHRQDFFFYEDAVKDLENLPFFKKEFFKTQKKRLSQKSYIFFTLLPTELIDHSIVFSIKKCNKAQINSKKRDEFLASVEQCIKIIESKTTSEEGNPPLIQCTKLKSNEILGIIDSTVSLNKKMYGDIEFDNSSKDLKVGKNYVDIFNISSLEDFSDSVNVDIKFERFDIDTSWGSFIAPLINFPHIVNSFVFIKDTKREKDKLESKSNILNSFASFSNSNSVIAKEVNEFVGAVEKEKLKIVDCHINIVIWDDKKNNLKIKVQNLSTILDQVGCKNIKVETFNKLYLFISSFAGNCVNIATEFRFKTFDLFSVAILNYASLAKSSIDGNSGTLVSDRLSKSLISIDIDEPYTKYGINKNMFVLGGSGSGKSFFMNYYLNSEMEKGADIVIVDIGRSYEGLVDIHNGLWFEHTAEKPLSFNPFVLSSKDYNEETGKIEEEKFNTICGIIKMLWQNVNHHFTQTENTIISDLVSDYFVKNIEIRNFNSFYEFAQGYNYNENLDFKKEEFLNNLRTYYKGGREDKLLNAENLTSLNDEKLMIFELDNIKGNPLLLALTTSVIMDAFISKMRRNDGRKIIVFEEAWSALQNKEMATVIEWLAKTARKYDSKLVLVTQELKDILKSSIGDSVIANSSEKIFLDISNLKGNFDSVMGILGVDAFQKQLILSINKGKELDDKSKDFFISFQYEKYGIYKNAVSRAEALLYSTTQSEKNAIKYVASKFDLSYKEAVQYIIENIISEVERIKKKKNIDFFTALKESLNK